MFDCGGISRGEGFTESIRRGSVFPGFFLKPGQDLFGKDDADFLVGDYQFVGTWSGLFPFGQITGGEKDTPQMVDTVVQFPIGQLLGDLFRDE